MNAKEQNLKVIRIIDVNLNRASEGLRVCEEYLRFYLDEKISTETLKKIRHQIKEISVNLPFSYKQLLESRNSVDDVGNASTVYKQCGVAPLDIFIANIKRVLEALRVLEEYLKIFSEKASSDFQKIRFEVYEFESYC